METILNFNNFSLFDCLRMSVMQFIKFTEKQEAQKQNQLTDVPLFGLISKYHIEIMRMYNSVL